MQPGRVTYSGLGSATLVEPEAAPVRSEAVQIDISSATVSQPAQDVAHAAHDNHIQPVSLMSGEAKRPAP